MHLVAPLTPCYFLLNFGTGRTSTAPRTHGNLAIFFWILVRRHPSVLRWGPRGPLLFSFEFWAPKWLGGGWKHGRGTEHSSLLFSFEFWDTQKLLDYLLTLLTDLLFSFEFWRNRAAQLPKLKLVAKTCYFLLNFGRALAIGTTKLEQSSISCYFLLNFGEKPCQGKRNMTTIVTIFVLTCYFLLNFGTMVQSNSTIIITESYFTLLFSFEFWFGDAEPAIVLKNLSTCYFLLNFGCER